MGNEVDAFIKRTVEDEVIETVSDLYGNFNKNFLSIKNIDEKTFRENVNQKLSDKGIKNVNLDVIFYITPYEHKDIELIIKK